MCVCVCVGGTGGDGGRMTSEGFDGMASEGFDGSIVKDFSTWCRDLDLAYHSDESHYIK